MAPTCCTPATPRMVAANPLDAEWATITPMASKFEKTVPPLAAIAERTAELSPGAVITR